MSNNVQRVLMRAGARELTMQEVENVAGSAGTTTACSAPSPARPNGDGDVFLHEC